MAKKGENIYRRKDGRWEARYIKGYDPFGRVKYGSCYGKTYVEAKEKAAKYRTAQIEGIQLPATKNNRRFIFFCMEWLKMERRIVKESTYAKYEMVITKHILPKLGGYFALGINEELVEQFKQDLLAKGLAAKTVRDILAILRSVLKYIARQFPGIVPAIEIIYPKEKKKEPRVLSPDEQARLVGYLQDDMDECKFGILLALLTGMRIGELCALRWENISLDKRTIYIEATMQRIPDLQHRGRTKIVIGHPKSDTSVRIIPLVDSVAELCGLFDPECPDAFVLTGTERFMEPRQLQKRLAKYTKECGLNGVHFHTIRHTFATRCVEVGFEIKSLSEILGHSNTTITLNRYVHSSMAFKRKNMEKLKVIGL